MHMKIGIFYAGKTVPVCQLFHGHERLELAAFEWGPEGDNPPKVD